MKATTMRNGLSDVSPHKQRAMTTQTKRKPSTDAKNSLAIRNSIVPTENLSRLKRKSSDNVGEDLMFSYLDRSISKFSIL